MRIEMMVQKATLPKDGLAIITEELEKRVLSVFPEAKIRVRSGTSKKEKKKIVSEIIENAFNEADEWLLQAV
jgi:hypothetical protein